MNIFFRRERPRGGGPAAGAGATQSSPAPPTQPEPPIAEALPLEIQKRMLRNIRRKLHSAPESDPP